MDNTLTYYYELVDSQTVQAEVYYNNHDDQLTHAGTLQFDQSRWDSLMLDLKFKATFLYGKYSDYVEPEKK